MKTSFVISSVFAAHCVVIGGALLFQGCGTTRGPVELPAERPMPPVATPAPHVVKKVPYVMPTPSKTSPQVKSWKSTDISSYVVGKGDTLSGIAHRYGVTVAEIMALNHISNQNKIMIGQKLVIPGKLVGKKVKKFEKTKPAGISVPAGGSVYVVQSGDCLSVIAHKAGVSTQAIRDANNLKNDVIYVGKKLVIPGGKKIVAAKPAKNKPEKTASPASEGSDIPDVSAAPALDAADFPLPDLAPELPVSAGPVQHHIVKQGETILDVVSEFNVSIADLRRVNNLKSDLLTPGQNLIIPTTE